MRLKYRCPEIRGAVISHQVYVHLPFQLAQILGYISWPKSLFFAKMTEDFDFFEGYKEFQSLGKNPKKPFHSSYNLKLLFNPYSAGMDFSRQNLRCFYKLIHRFN